MRLRLFLLSFALANLSYNGVQYAVTAQSETRPAVLSAEDMMRILPGNTLLAYDEILSHQHVLRAQVFKSCLALVGFATMFFTVGWLKFRTDRE